MSDIAAVIFDMYETLVHNSPTLWVKTFDEICEVQELPLTGQELWDWWKPIELDYRKARNQGTVEFKSYRQAWRECFEGVFGKMGKGDAVDAADRSVRDQGVRELYSESAGVIARLREAGRFRLGLLSNADTDALWPLVHRHGLEFDGVVSSESARVYKPAAGAFHRISEALNVQAEACLYVGDSLLDDVFGASSAGMKTAWVNRYGAQPDPALPAPDYQVKDLTELLGILGVPE